MEEASACLLGRHPHWTSKHGALPISQLPAPPSKTAGCSSQWPFLTPSLPLMWGCELKIPTTSEEGDPRGAWAVRQNWQWNDRGNLVIINPLVCGCWIFFPFALSLWKLAQGATSVYNHRMLWCLPRVDSNLVSKAILLGGRGNKRLGLCMWAPI